MAGTNTSDSETIPQNFQKNGVSKVIGNIGRGAAGLALGLGMVAGSPSPVEAQIRNDDKPKQEFRVNNENREGYFDVKTTSNSKGFGPNVDGNAQGKYFYLSGAPRPLPEGTNLGDGVTQYDDLKSGEGFGKGRNFMASIQPEGDEEGIQSINIIFDNATSGYFDPTKISLETRGGGVATITTFDFDNARQIKIIPNSPLGELVKIEKDVERTVGSPVDYVLVTLIDPITGKEIQWETVITLKDPKPDIN